MIVADVLKQLRSLGNERTAATYRRHGAKGNVLGVKYGDLGKLQKKIKVDHALAQALWASGLHEARILATQVADASRATKAGLQAWAKDAADGPVAEALAARTASAAALRTAWTKASVEGIQRAGWNLVARSAQEGSLPAGEAREWLAQIAERIHKAPNWVRRSMLSALIAIGGIDPALRKAAEVAVGRIGPVEFDPGDTACELPEPIPYLARIWARKQV